VPSRRQVLAGFTGVAAAGLAGCTDVVLQSGSQGEGDTIEIIVTNDAAETVHLGVRVEDDGGNALFSRVYRLEPGTTDQSAGIETAPAVIRVFTPDGTDAAWEYDPDSGLDCAGQDVGVTYSTDSTIESWYGC
jgi:hypothetical protein